MTIPKKKKEALFRMKTLRLPSRAITRFRKEGKVSISDDSTLTSSWAEGKDLERIQKFENKYKVLVYAVIRTHAQMGMMDSYLFVSDYEDEWNHDRAELTRTIDDVVPLKRLFAYAYNHAIPDFSDFGHIGVTVIDNLGLFRIW